TYEPLTRLRPAGFSSGLLAAIDAGLMMAAGDPPQSIADLRAMVDPPSPRGRAAAVASPVPQRGFGLWLGVAAAVLLVLAGGGYYFPTSQPSLSAGPRAPAPGAAKAA